MHIYIRGRVNAFDMTMSEHAISFYENFLIKIIKTNLLKVSVNKELTDLREYFRM